MRIVTNSIKKISFIVLLISVIFLIIAAIYTNIDRFKNSDTVRYTKVNITDGNISNLVHKYADSKTEQKFIDEVKRVNDLESIENIDNAVILVPILETN